MAKTNCSCHKPTSLTKGAITIIFLKKRAQRTTAAVIVASIVLALCLVIAGFNDNGTANNYSKPQGTTRIPAVTTQVQSNPVVTAATASKTAANAKTKVAYGATKYPSLTNVDYSTYRTLDYLTCKGNTGVFYDFRKTWHSDVRFKKGALIDIRYYGVVASADKNVLTYKLYVESSNVTVKSVGFYTFDEAQSIPLDATANKDLTCKTDKLANGPYIFGVWFNVTENGKTTTVPVSRIVYVSDGNAWFADYIALKPGTDVKAWVAKQHDYLAAADALQAWVASQGGNDLAKAASLTGISYPFQSGTDKYPNDTAKWQGLAHEICPDANAGEYTKAAAIYAWMSTHLAYDKNARAYTGGADAYRWATAATTGDAKNFTTWSSHIGMCEDFANIYAIMCRELGIPCHVMNGYKHAWNVVYLHGRWELVDVTNNTGEAYLGADKDFVANAKAYWDKPKNKNRAVSWVGFAEPAWSVFKIGSYENYSTVEQKISACQALDKCLYDTNYFNLWKGTIYGH